MNKEQRAMMLKGLDEGKTSGLVEVPELKEIEPSKATEIENAYVPMVEMLKSFESQHKVITDLAKEGITKEVTLKAETLRKAISQVRIQGEKVRKSQKKTVLLTGRAIDGYHAMIELAVIEKENELKVIEKHFEIKIKKMKDALQDIRAEALAKYIEGDVPTDLHAMPCDVWGAYLDTKIKHYEDKIAAELEVKRLEDERVLAEKIENERIRFENEALKVAHKKRELEIAREQKILTDNLNAERIEMERKASIERELLNKERVEKEKIERAEIERRKIAEEKLALIKEAEQRAIEEAKRKEQEDLCRGDSDKLIGLSSDLLKMYESIKTKYVLKSDVNKVKVSIVLDGMASIMNELGR
tara:strand:+ start:345 stop:1418 length:1074 start_codon:yes stop_codon:yes gene_type:complete